MDTKKCKKCAEEIKKEAKQCKHCGTKQGIGPCGVCGIIFGLFILFVITGGGNSTQKNITTKVDNGKNDGSYAVVCAQNEVEKSLKSPSTADFPWGIQGTPLGNDKYLVSSYVDAENSFGAEIRTYFVCNVTVIDTKSFKCQTECAF
ncbi:hypothetical protein HN748_00950 [Candidatus Peregrinibacteria bacterium]|jgi:hypothetical protein|nr:hypothetical protein [Candidatus Peregrinibacteria bacterium]MBT7483503.1 hypothetical protein [Candidatus Peregrinibacteria bacterium]MBT7702779.1 hypothetical protein [Candidatus Peregrinibacteria bacterium]